MASTTFDRPVRLIRVQPNPVFQEPKHLPIKPLTRAAVEIERPPDYLESCIHRGLFKDIHPDLLKDYAKHYNINIDPEKVLRAEIMAVLCMKNEWIPVLPQHTGTHVEGEKGLLSTTPEDDGDAPIVGPDAEVETYIPDRFGTPEDSYDNDAGPSTAAADPNSGIDNDTIEDGDFDMLPSSISLEDLVKLTSRLQARHTQVQCALKDATAATREAAANVLEMTARLETEKSRMKKIMGTVSDIVGEYDEKIELNEGNDEEVDEEVESNTISEKRKGKKRATEPIHSSAHYSSSERGSSLSGLRPSPLCPNCRVARDLTVSQRHSVYLCAEHMPNPYQVNETPSEGSRGSTSATRSLPGRNAKRRFVNHSPNGDSTIIFGLTTKPFPAPNSPSKGKKRSREENGADEGSHSNSTSNNQSPKRARIEGRNSSPIPTPASKHSVLPTPTILVGGSSDPGIERDVAFSIINYNDFPNAATGGESAAEAAPLTRRFTIEDFDDLDEVARVERMESSIAFAPRSDVPLTGLKPRGNAPLGRTLSIIDLDDSEELVNALREHRQLRRSHAQTASANNSNAVTISEMQQPSASSSRVPLRRTISVQDLNDLEEVANAEREENFPASGIPAPGPTMSEEPAVTHRQPSPTTRTNEPLRRAFSISDINDSREVAGVETLTTARVDLRTTESTSPGSSPAITGKRPRDSDGVDDEEGQMRIQKKGRFAEA